MTVQCPNCDATASTSKALRQHAYLKHADPTPFTLPDGSIQQVTTTDHGTYVCWCGVERSGRETITSHVQKEHVQDTSIKITLFRSKIGKLFNGIPAAHYLPSYAGPPPGEVIEETSEDSPEPGLVPPPVAPQPGKTFFITQGLILTSNPQCQCLPRIVLLGLCPAAKRVQVCAPLFLHMFAAQLFSLVSALPAAIPQIENMQHPVTMGKSGTSCISQF